MKNYLLTKLLLAAIFSFSFTAKAVEVNKDSLWSVFNNDNLSDSSRLKAIYDLAWDGYLFSDPDSAIYYAEHQITFSKNVGLKGYQAKGINLKAIAYRIKGDFVNAAQFYEESLQMVEETGDSVNINKSYNNIGNFYYYQADYARSIEYFFKSLEYKEALGDTVGMATSINNLSSNFMALEEYDKAKEYYNKGLKLSRAVKDSSGIAHALNNLGVVYAQKDSIEKAMNYYTQALNIRKQIKHSHGMIGSLNNMGNIYKRQKMFEKALTLYFKCIHIADSIGEKQYKASSYENIADTYYELGQFNESLKYCKLGLETATSAGLPDLIKSINYTLYKSYTALGQYKNALESHVAYTELKDSLQSESNARAILQRELQYNFDKKSIADSIQNAAESLIKDQQIANRDEKIKYSKQLQQILWGGISLVVILAFVILIRLLISKKQNKIINKQKITLEEQKQEVEKAHIILAEHHKEIGDSIEYAKRIQEAIMPSMKEMNKALNNGFVLYLPKDVVAGDFYWMEQVENSVYFAAADCTGHGVPGAMVSVVCSNALNKAILEDNIRDTGELLDRTREIVVDRLARSGVTVNDGMDIALVSMNYKEVDTSGDQFVNLQYSGANNPIWIIRKGATTIEEIKATKQPIGKYEFESPFTSHLVKLQKGDTIYIFSDGFQDQFGGPKGKKFKTGNMKKLLLEIQDKSMDEQNQLLKETFFNWKGDLEQIDDVCVIGVRL